MAYQIRNTSNRLHCGGNFICVFNADKTNQVQIIRTKAADYLNCVTVNETQDSYNQVSVFLH